MQVPDQRYALDAGPDPPDEQTDAHVGVNDIWLECRDSIFETEECRQQFAWGLRLVEVIVGNSEFLQQFLVSAMAADKGHGMARLDLLDAEVDGQVHDAVSAVGKVVDDVQYSHGPGSVRRS